MRRPTFVYCLLLACCADAAIAQTGAGRIHTHASGSTRASGSGPTPATSAPPRQQPASGGHRWQAASAHAYHSHHRHRPRWECEPGWTWLWPPVFVLPVWSSIGYTFSTPLAPAYTAAPVDPTPVAVPPAPADPVPVYAPRTSGPEQKARAGRYLSYGDRQFTQQKYLAALGRYKSATTAAADMAEGHLRQGFAYVAMEQYENAAKAFRRGLSIRSNGPGTAFRLATLYDGDNATKIQHLEKLAKAVEANPFDANLLTVLGIALFFDGQFDRAELCFSRAVQLGGDADRLLTDFLPGPKPAGASASQKISF